MHRVVWAQDLRVKLVVGSTSEATNASMCPSDTHPRHVILLYGKREEGDISFNPSVERCDQTSLTVAAAISIPRNIHQQQMVVTSRALRGLSHQSVSGVS